MREDPVKIFSFLRAHSPCLIYFKNLVMRFKFPRPHVMFCLLEERSVKQASSNTIGAELEGPVCLGRGISRIFDHHNLSPTPLFLGGLVLMTETRCARACGKFHRLGS